MQLSIVLSARDTAYGGDFIDRLYRAVSTNIQTLNECFIDYEIIIVDYNPLQGQYLYKNKKLKKLLSYNKIKNIIVDNSIILKENLTSTTFYEYFAKNVGIRNSIGDFIFVTNADIVLSSELCNEIKHELTNPEKDTFFYRCRYRGKIIENKIYNEVSDLHKPNLDDSCICGLYSGDGSMFSRKVMFTVAKGYNEELEQHRTNLCQLYMDGEILWNCYLNNLSLKFLNGPYFHIEHPLGHTGRDNFYCKEKYSNKLDWGYINYPMYQLDINAYIIKL